LCVAKYVAAFKKHKFPRSGASMQHSFVSWRTCAVVYSSLQSFVFIQERCGIQET
jgi:hypothetical protein